MTAHQSINPQNLSSRNLLKEFSEKDRTVSKLHKDNVASLPKLSGQPSKKKINRIIEKLKNFEELEFQKILILRVVNKDE
jgi:hypothetical protein